MNTELKLVIDKLFNENILTNAEFKIILEGVNDKDMLEYIYSLARIRQKENYSNEVFTRGLIEISNICKNDCLYCGIRKSNKEVSRYRLSEDEIFECAKSGYELDFKTFVLQGGEDAFFTDDVLEKVIKRIKNKYPDCAITLSLGERSYESYERLFEAGADRYLLRHETANEEHYKKLHPSKMSIENRKKCLYNLKKIGYQTGCGIMVGSPYQTLDNIIEDLFFMKDLNPQMIGIGPFIPQKDTPFGDMKQGTLDMTLLLLAILRLMFPKVLLPATTALGTINPKGRELGLLAGANVVMPNLSPVKVRKKYLLYDNKICTGEEAAECRGCLQRRVESIGYKLVSKRGDYPQNN